MNIQTLLMGTLLASLGLVSGCQVSINEDNPSNEIRDRVLATMDCDAYLNDIKAVGPSMDPQNLYARLDRLVKTRCQNHQGLLAERFVIGSLYRIGAPPDELIRSVDWRSSTDRELLMAVALAAIKRNLASPSPEDVLDHFVRIAPEDFLPHLLRARLSQQRDDFSGVERELQAATRLLGGRKSEVFDLQRAMLAPIFFLEGRPAEAYSMSMDFLRFYGDEAWNSPDMIGIAAMSAIDQGKPEEAMKLLNELRRRNPDAVSHPAIVAAQADLELKHPELL